MCRPVYKHSFHEVRAKSKGQKRDSYKFYSKKNACPCILHQNSYLFIILFAESTTGKLFKDLGILEHSQHAWQKTLSTSARGYLWVETNAPIYYTKTIEVWKPYGQLSKDTIVIVTKKASVLYENVKDYVVEKTPVVVSTIEHYAPGLIENVQSYSSAGISAVKKYSYEYYSLTADYLKTKVFM